MHDCMNKVRMMIQTEGKSTETGKKYRNKGNGKQYRREGVMCGCPLQLSHLQSGLQSFSSLEQTLLLFLYLAHALHGLLQLPARQEHIAGLIRQCTAGLGQASIQLPGSP